MREHEATPAGVLVRPMTVLAGAQGVLVLALAAALAFHEIISRDLWLHLSAGRWILAHGTVPREDVFSFTAAGHRWIDLHWGYQLLVTAAFRLGGAVGIQVLHAAAFLGTWGVIARLVARRGGGGAAWIVALVALVAGYERVLCRPELFTALFLVVTWWLTDRVLAGERVGPAWLLVQVLWANMQGLFILGPALVGARAVGAAGDRLVARRSARGGAGGVPGATEVLGAPVRRLAAGAVLMLAVSVATPYHVHGVWLPFRLMTQVGGESVYAGVLGELLSPFVESPIGWVLVALAALSALAWLLDPGRRVADLVPLAAFAILAFSARRNALLFALVAVIPTIPSLHRVMVERGGGRLRWLQVPVGVAGVLIGGILTLAVVGGRFYHELRSPKSTGLGFSERAYPREATRFLSTMAPGGRVFNEIGDGDYLIWHLTPAWTIAFDGRAEVYGETVGHALLPLYQSPERLTEFARANDVHHALLDVSTPMGRNLAVGLARTDAWHLRYLDDRGAILTDEPGASSTVMPRSPASTSVPPPSRRSALAWRVDFPWREERLARAQAAFGLGEAALGSYAEALRRYPHSADLYADFGATLLTVGRLNEAMSAFSAALTLDGDHDAGAAGRAIALERLDGPAAAIGWLEPWCASRPRAEAAWTTLAGVEGRSGDVTGAIETLRTAYGRMPDVVVPLATTLARLGRVDEARALLETHLSRHPKDRAARALAVRLARPGR